MSSEAENKNEGAVVDGDEQFGPTEIESMCPRCEENVCFDHLTAVACMIVLQGTTRILVTLIPFYKSVILMSFACDNCNYRNNELQSGGKVQEQGLRITLRVMNTKVGSRLGRMRSMLRDNCRN
jgi:zinc finger protein